MIEINNTTKFKINNRLIKKIAEKFLQSRRLAKKDLSLAFIGDAKMRQLNFKYRRKDKTTDVLSFGAPLLSKEGPGVVKISPLLSKEGFGGGSDLGEILINPAQIKRQAKANNNSFQDELIFILVHGLLHLAGYNDETEKERIHMINLGKKFIGELEKESLK